MITIKSLNRHFAPKLLKSDEFVEDSGKKSDELDKHGAVKEARVVEASNSKCRDLRYSLGYSAAGHNSYLQQIPENLRKYDNFKQIASAIVNGGVKLSAGEAKISLVRVCAKVDKGGDTPLGKFELSKLFAVIDTFPYITAESNSRDDVIDGLHDFKMELENCLLAIYNNNDELPPADKIFLLKVIDLFSQSATNNCVKHDWGFGWSRADLADLKKIVKQIGHAKINYKPPHNYAGPKLNGKDFLSAPSGKLPDEVVDGLKYVNSGSELDRNPPAYEIIDYSLEKQVLQDS